MLGENVEIVRRVLRRLNDQDLDAAAQDIRPEAELDWSDSQAPDGGVYHGREGWSAWMRGRGEGLSDLRFDITEVIDVPPDRVVVVARLLARGRASGINVDALGAVVWTLRDGMVTSGRLYQTRDEAREAVGLTG
jgi:ketosteroid isomerase-like protein